MDDYEWLYFLLIVPFLMFLCCAWYDLHRKPKAARMVPVYVPQTPPPIAMQMVQMVPVPPVQPVQIAYGHLSKPGEQLSREECEAFGVPVGSTYTDGGFTDHPEQAYGWVPQGQSAPSPVPWGVRGEYPPPAADPLRNAPPGLAQPAPPPPPMGAVPNGGVTPVQRGAPGPPRPSAPPDVPQLATRAAGFTGAPTAPPAPPARVMGGMGPPPNGMGLNPWGDRATPTPFVGNTADGFDQGARRAAFIGLEVTSTPPHAVQQVSFHPPTTSVASCADHVRWPQN